MSEIPRPVRATVGLVASAVDTVRTSPEKLIELPMLAVSTALQFSLRAQQRYMEMAVRGDQVLGRFHPVPEEPPAWATFDDDGLAAAIASAEALADAELDAAELAAVEAAVVEAAVVEAAAEEAAAELADAELDAAELAAVDSAVVEAAVLEAAVVEAAVLEAAVEEAAAELAIEEALVQADEVGGEAPVALDADPAGPDTTTVPAAVVRQSSFAGGAAAGVATHRTDASDNSAISSAPAEPADDQVRTATARKSPRTPGGKKVSAPRGSRPSAFDAVTDPAPAPTDDPH